MQKKTLKTVLMIVGSVTVLGAATVLAGCADQDVISGDDAQTSTTLVSSEEPSATTTPTLVASEPPTNERVVVGGSTAEEYAEALPELEKAVEADPNDLDALQQLAIAQYNTGRYEEAADTYQKMLSIKDDAFTRNNYGNVLRDWGKAAEAKAAYEQSIAADATLVTPYINLASLLVREESVDEAIAFIDRGLQAVGEDDQERLQTFRDRLTGQE